MSIIKVQQFIWQCASSKADKIWKLYRVLVIRCLSGVTPSFATAGQPFSVTARRCAARFWFMCCGWLGAHWPPNQPQHINLVRSAAGAEESKRAVGQR